MPATTCSQRKIEPAHSVSTTCKVSDSVHRQRAFVSCQRRRGLFKQAADTSYFGGRLLRLADHPFDVPVEVAHLVAAPRLARRDAHRACVVGNGASEGIEALGDLVGGSGDEP